MSALVTKDTINDFFAKHTSHEARAAFIGRALVVLFNNQEEDEKRTNDTRHHNGIGFTGADAHSGSLTAKYFLRHGTLAEWMVDRWMKRGKRGMRIAKYHRQLNEAANRRAA